MSQIATAAVDAANVIYLEACDTEEGTSPGFRNNERFDRFYGESIDWQKWSFSNPKTNDSKLIIRDICERGTRAGSWDPPRRRSGNSTLDSD